MASVELHASSAFSFLRGSSLPEELVRRAAELKARHAIAYADAFAVTTALEFEATLLTGDPEIEPLEGQQNLAVQWLPRKP